MNCSRNAGATQLTIAAERAQRCLIGYPDDGGARPLNLVVLRHPMTRESIQSDTVKTALPSPVTLWIGLGVLAVLAGLAIRLFYYSAMYSGADELLLSSLARFDPGRPERFIVILLGIVLPLLPSFVAILAWTRSTAAYLVVPHLGLAAANLDLGWRCYPFWALGVPQAQELRSRVTYYDPLNNPPGMLPSAGSDWYVLVLALSVAIIPVALVLLILGIRHWRQYSGLARVSILLAPIVILACEAATTGYWDWILD